MMKLYATCFRDKEAISAIQSLGSTQEKCPYDNQDSYWVYVDEYADILYGFFAIFEESEEGRPFIELLHEDWELFNEDMPQYRRFLDDLLEDLRISYAADSKVSYINQIQECVGLWDKLKQTLICERRFILKNGESPDDYEWDVLLLPNKQMEANETLYRARINEEEHSAAYTIEEMSAPPAQKTPGGRANSAGIPVLYLCRDRETAAYEVRSLHNDAITIGEFKVKDGEKLDIVDFTDVPSIFSDSGSLDEAKRYLLMRRISRDLSRPMRRYSRKTEYVPTQFICEFIRFVIGADAIQFASSLKEGGINLVVFDPQKMECVGTEPYTVSDYQLQIRRI